MHAFAKVARTTWGLSYKAMETIYDSIFLPVLTYGCGTWGSAVEKVHPKRKLISAQRRALLLITKAFRTSSNASLQVLARKPPVDKYINYLHKIWSIKCGNFSASVSDLFDGESWEGNIPYKYAISPYTNFRFNEVSSTDCVITIYTDGSKCGSHVGASFVMYRNETEIFCNLFRLGSLCNIFQVELYAILQAIKWCERVANNTRIAIITDSLSSLSVIRRKSAHPLVFNIQQLLVDTDNEYYFQWTHSHCNNWGNDRADELAKMAAEDQNIIISYNKVSTKVLKAVLWNQMIEDWQIDWNLNTSITKQFFPDIKKFLHNTWIAVTHHSVQFYTGHGHFNSYLTRFTSHTNNLCPVCDVIDGSLHYIFECPMTECKRHCLRALLIYKNHSWPCEIQDLTMDKDTHDLLYKLFEKYFIVTPIS
ncbi:uncharacterized protein [Centruroides vittatus]|uniref:uncharacterized protein n=1 Tax=Centruroides vittatus TaxID=120091 RepID=UPI00350EB6E1